MKNVLDSIKFVKYLTEGVYIKADSGVCGVCGENNSEAYVLQEGINACNVCMTSIGKGVEKERCLGYLRTRVDISEARRYLKENNLKHYLKNLENMVERNTLVLEDGGILLNEGDIKRFSIVGVDRFFKIIKVVGNNTYEAVELK